jgi:hypothetical protein
MPPRIIYIQRTPAGTAGSVPTRSVPPTRAAYRASPRPQLCPRGQTMMPRVVSADMNDLLDYLTRMTLRV